MLQSYICYISSCRFVFCFVPGQWISGPVLVFPLTSWVLHRQALYIRIEQVYLTSGKDKLVAGQICLITEDVRLFHVQVLCDPQKPKEMIVYCHSCNSLKYVFSSQQ